MPRLNARLFPLCFLLVWLIYWLIILVFPAAPVAKNQEINAVLIEVVFVFAALVCCLFFWKVHFVSRSSTQKAYGEPSLASISQYIRLGVCLSLAALFLLAYGRIYLEGISYDQGFAAARAAWAKHAGGSSALIIDSVAYVFGSTFFISSWFLMLFWEKLRFGFRWVNFLLVVSILGANSYLLGGRSILMLWLCFVFIALLLRRVYGANFLPSYGGRRFILALIVLIAVFFFCGYVFLERSQVSGVSVSSYVQNFMPYLGAQLEGSFSSLESLILLVLAYFINSHWTLERLLDLNYNASLPGHVSFNYLFLLLHRLHLLSSPIETPLLSGRFLSAPGGFFYDYGICGVVVGGALLGALMGATLKKIETACFSVLGAGAFTCVWLVAFLSPLLLVVNVMSFPFILIAFVIYFVIERARGRRLMWSAYQQ